MLNQLLKVRQLVWLLILLFVPVLSASAQEATEPAPAIPAAYQMNGFIHIAQHWNNCGPATLTMGLTYFGFAADQNPAASWLKPTNEDGNVSPWQMVDYVNKQLAGSVRALTRVGGDLTLLKTLIAHNFPVIIEAGYDPEPDRLGWMGHYLLVMGYDDSTQNFLTQDSYLGANTSYTYQHVDQFWEHFNNTYIVLYKLEQEQTLMGLLGTNADPTQNALNALELNRQRALNNPEDKFAWFNLGSSYVMLGDYDPKAYEYAAAAYDQARTLNLPWRMNWYQFGMYEAYNAVGRYDDVLELTRIQLNEQGTSQYIEETFYYGGLARAGKGETDRALNNLSYALQLNPNFSPAQEAINQLNTVTASG
jgi:tetratricopeptide (TPR) repeat protein